MGPDMGEPTIRCPKCETEIKLTESLAAPLVESIRQDYEKRLLTQRDEIAKREETIKSREAALAKEKEAVDAAVAEKLKSERSRIAAEELKKAKLALSNDLEQKAKELTDLQDVLKQRDEKLAEAQKAQTDLLRKQRELDDEKRALELTVETRIQESLAVTREQAKKEAEAVAAITVKEKDQAIATMQNQIGELTKREQSIKDREAELLKEREGLDVQVAEKLNQERAKIVADEARKAKAATATDLAEKTKELAELQEISKQREAKLAEAQKAQAELIRKQRELDDAKREMDLTIETRVQESLGKAREQAKKEAEDQLSLKVMEKEQTIAAMQKTIEELKRKSEQGSQQLQGEVLELQLESLLSSKFPHDRIEPVPKGEHGGDILHRVVTPTGVPCGTLLWESKRTKNWSNGWLAKLREDQRAAKAEIAVLVSAILPPGVESFDQVDGVWIVHPRCILPVALSLRQMLIEVNGARQASEGQQTKMELMYQYLTGSKFRLRVQAIVEAFTDMAEDLTREKKAILKQWAKREEQIERVMHATVGMYGEMQGIAGKSLQEIDGLCLPSEQPTALLK